MAARFTDAEACTRTPTPVEEGGLPAHALDEAMAKLGDFWDMIKVFVIIPRFKQMPLLPSRHLVKESRDYRPWKRTVSQLSQHLQLL